MGWKVYDRDGVLKHRFEVDHFPTGIETENRQYDENDHLVRREAYFYDEEGRKTETYYYDSNNLLCGTGLVERDSSGKFIAENTSI